MKSVLLLLYTALLFQTSLKSQSFKFGTIAADLGTGFGVYGLSGHSPVNGSDVSGIGGVGTLPRFNTEFGVLKFLGAGISYRRGTYGKRGISKLRGNDIMVRANVHLLNDNDKFDLPIGIGYGFSTFNGDLSATQYIHTKGGILNFHVSPHFYFSDYVGMFLSVGYNKHLFNKVEMKDGNTYYTEADGATWKMGGVYFELGISGRVHLFNKGDNSLDKKH